MEQPIQQINSSWSPIDHDLLITVKTTLDMLVSDVKLYNQNNSALELRVRTLENDSNKAFGGWKMSVLIIGALAGFAGLVIAGLNYFVPHSIQLVK